MRNGSKVQYLKQAQLHIHFGWIVNLYRPYFANTCFRVCSNIVISIVFWTSFYHLGVEKPFEMPHFTHKQNDVLVNFIIKKCTALSAV